MVRAILIPRVAALNAETWRIVQLILLITLYTLPLEVCWDLSPVISLKTKRGHWGGSWGGSALSCIVTALAETITISSGNVGLIPSTQRGSWYQGGKENTSDGVGKDTSTEGEKAPSTDRKDSSELMGPVSLASSPFPFPASPYSDL